MPAPGATLPWGGPAPGVGGLAPAPGVLPAAVAPMPPVGAAPAGDTSPVELAEEFFAAVAGGDCAAMIERMTPESYATEGQTAAEAVAECEADESGTAAVAAADARATIVEFPRDPSATPIAQAMALIDRAVQLPSLPLGRQPPVPGPPHLPHLRLHELREPRELARVRPLQLQLKLLLAFREPGADRC